MTEFKKGDKVNVIATFEQLKGIKIVAAAKFLKEKEQTIKEVYTEYIQLSNFFTLPKTFVQKCQ